MALSGPAFVQEIRDTIRSSPYVLANHPFIDGVQAGTISLPELRFWAIQDSHYRRAVPRLAMLRYMRCTDPHFRTLLGGVLAEEAEGTQTGSAGHYDLFLRFAASIGLSAEEVESSTPVATTGAHVYWVELILWTLPWFVAMSAQMAGEWQGPPAVKRMYAGLTTHYGLSPEQAAFFSVHGEADEDHGLLVEQIIERYLVTDELQEQARAVVWRKLRLQYEMWDSYLATPKATAATR